METVPGHGGPRRNAGPQGPRARRGLRARAVRGLATAATTAAALLAAAGSAWAQADPYCTATYGTDPPQTGAPIRFGVDPELAGSVGTGQGSAKPLDEAQDLAALRRLTPPGKAMVLRINRLFWADGDAGIERFAGIVRRHAEAGFDSEIQVRYHPAAGDEGDMAAWTAYVRHVVDVLGADRHVVAMTITNEVNLNISQNTSDGAYAGARDAVIGGIIAARDEADRIGRTDMPFGFTYAYRWQPGSDAAFWTALAAGGDAFRSALGFVGVDIYPGTFYPPAISPASSPGQEMVKGLATVRRCYMPMAQLGPEIPIWVTENGFQSGAQGDDAGQAAALRDMVAATIAVSGTYGVTDYRWFNLRDNLTGSAGIFDTTGLLRDDYSEKPAFGALRDLVAQHGATAPVAPRPRCVTHVTLRLPRGARRYVARLDGRRVPGRRHGRRVRITFRHRGTRHVVVTTHTRAGKRVRRRRTVLACRRPKASAAGRARTIVTLEFDVATADQAKALPLLSSHGMHGTFYVNSGFVGHPGHLTWPQLRHMQASGEEIAGQTVDHARLTRLSPEQARREICGDRAALLRHGLAADAFAYPFGAYSGAVRDVVAACGYSSARLASGIAGAGKRCIGCPYAESIPPHNRFATRMPPAVQRTTRLARLTRAVRDARRSGGGWVQILIHHVCSGCHRYAITPRALAHLLEWLDRQPDVDIRTVSQLMDAGGPTVRVLPPAGGTSTTDELTTFPVRFSARRGVRSVRFFVDGRTIGTKTLAPWRLRWYRGSLPPGRHEVRALLEDGAGNAAISPRRVFTTEAGR